MSSRWKAKGCVVATQRAPVTKETSLRCFSFSSSCVLASTNRRHRHQLQESSGSTRRSRLRRRGGIDTTAAGWPNTLSVKTLKSAKQYTLAGMIAYVTAYKTVSADLLKLYGSRTERAAAFSRRCQQRQFYASIPSALGVDAETVVCAGSGFLGSGASRGNMLHTGVMVGSVCLFVCLFACLFARLFFCLLAGCIILPMRLSVGVAPLSLLLVLYFWSSGCLSSRRGCAVSCSFRRC
jgi:hypothetical protein